MINTSICNSKRKKRIQKEVEMRNKVLKAYIEESKKIHSREKIASKKIDELF